MQIILNGEPREVAESLDLSGLLTELGLDARKIAVERNLEIVPRSTYDETRLGGWRQAGDRCISSAAAMGRRIPKPRPTTA